MSLQGYIRSDWEVIKKLADAGEYDGYVEEPIKRRPPFWILQPIERWRWEKQRKEVEALDRCT